MARLERNGVEIARCFRMQYDPQYEDFIETFPWVHKREKGRYYERVVYSYRSNGAVVYKKRQVKPDGYVTAWGSWKHVDPNKREWTLKQQRVHWNLQMRLKSTEVWCGWRRPKQEGV